MRLILLLALVLSLIAPISSFAALRLQNAAVESKDAWNPVEEADDILLPLPCSLFLALRTVAVPGGVSRDRRFVMGVNNAGAGRQIYESSFESHIAASFSAADLPKSFSTKLGTAKADAFSYYFLSKYEISRQQWDAVMTTLARDGSEDATLCPRESTRASTLPVRDVSWFDVQEFLTRLNAWLIRNKADSIPRYAGTKNVGFLRLPTEEEWEFAARGGIAVREEDRENNDSFLAPEDRAEDYGVFLGEGQSVREEPLPIGSRKPNPLHIHDTMGNVREMIEGFFHLTIEEIAQDNSQRRRLHGASGGLLCKGGSFRSSLDGVLPGWRDELPLYTSAGEYRAPDLGFRVVLAGINIPGAGRLKEMNAQGPSRAETAVLPPKKEEKPKPDGHGAKEEKESLLTLNQQGDVLAELDRISDATSSSVLRANLAQLRNMVARREKAQQLQQVDFLENTVRSSLYQAETIRAFAFRYLETVRLLSGEQKVSLEQKKKVRDFLNNYYQVLLTSANQYKSHLRRIMQAKPEQLAQITAQLSKEYSGPGTLDRHMQQNLKTLAAHLAIARGHGLEQLASERVCRDIIPKQHLEKMPHFTH